MPKFANALQLLISQTDLSVNQNKGIFIDQSHFSLSVEATESTKAELMDKALLEASEVRNMQNYVQCTSMCLIQFTLYHDAVVTINSNLFL